MQEPFDMFPERGPEFSEVLAEAMGLCEADDFEDFFRAFVHCLVAEAAAVAALVAAPGEKLDSFQAMSAALKYVIRSCEEMTAEDVETLVECATAALDGRDIVCDSKDDDVDETETDVDELRRKVREACDTWADWHPTDDRLLSLKTDLADDFQDAADLRRRFDDF